MAIKKLEFDSDWTAQLRDLTDKVNEIIEYLNMVEQQVAPMTNEYWKNKTNGQ